MTTPFPPTIAQHLRAEVGRHPYPLLFATVSGAHLYGFPSPDSDFDLRGVHVLPVQEVVGLDPGRETVDSTTTEGGVEMDLVTHDVKKFSSCSERMATCWSSCTRRWSWSGRRSTRS